jgi:Ca2+-binding RTX toxin-like protein
MQPKLLLPLAAAALVFAVPAAADAAVTSQINGTNLVLTGDAADDNVTIGVNNAGLLTHNLGGPDNTDFDLAAPGAQTLPSNDSIAVTLNLGAGNDTSNLSAANLANSIVNGEPGDDIITAGDNLDQISGGDGSDRITGFRGNDVVNGDAGNDVMIWNNGDGTDDNLGGDGVDETLITNGAANDQMTVKLQGPVTRFDRINAPFGMNLTTVERLNITSFSGNDSLVTDPGVAMNMTVDAGSGDDTITTGDGVDVVNGGDGNDTLNGAAGGDRLIGDRGADTHNGGEGDDTLVWNNGDGSDVMNGDGGVDRIENNLGAGTDVSTLKPENGRVRYDRTNVGQFSLSVATAEQFELNSLGGDDTLTTAPGVGITVFADGGAGNDAFNVREGDAGFFVGGSGADSATVDAADATGADIETVSRPEPQPPFQPGAGTIGKKAKVKGNKAAIKVSCPAGTSGCNGYVTLLLSKREIGRAAYALKAGESKTFNVKVSRKPTKRKALTVTARVSSRAGKDKESRLKLVL